MCSIFCGGSVNIIEINMPNLEGKPQPRKPQGKSKTRRAVRRQFNSLAKCIFLYGINAFCFCFILFPFFFFLRFGNKTRCFDMSHAHAFSEQFSGSCDSHFPFPLAQTGYAHFP